jgi:hypothetical protein
MCKLCSRLPQSNRFTSLEIPLLCGTSRRVGPQIAVEIEHVLSHMNRLELSGVSIVDILRKRAQLGVVVGIEEIRHREALPIRAVDDSVQGRRKMVVGQQFHLTDIEADVA